MGFSDKKRGFTLVEIVVSMLLLSAVVAGMLVVFVVGRRSVGLAGHKVEAINFAQETIERLKGRVGGHLWPPGTPGSGDLDSVPPTHNDPLPSGNPLEKFGGGRGYTVTKIGPPDPADGYKRVTVTVTWNEP